MINVLQKIFFSFLIAAVFFAGIAALVFTGVFDINEYFFIFPQQIQILIGAVFFLALFLIVFFYLNLRQSFMEEDDPWLVEFGDSGLAGEDEAAELEDISTGHGGAISILGRLFAFSPGNPELLQEAGTEVIYEINGIHYINSGAFNRESNTDRELDNDFAQLVESVVNKV